MANTLWVFLYQGSEEAENVIILSPSTDTINPVLTKLASFELTELSKEALEELSRIELEEDRYYYYFEIMGRMYISTEVIVYTDGSPGVWTYLLTNWDREFLKKAIIKGISKKATEYGLTI